MQGLGLLLLELVGEVVVDGVVVDFRFEEDRWGQECHFFELAPVPVEVDFRTADDLPGQFRLDWLEMRRWLDCAWCDWSIVSNLDAYLEEPDDLRERQVAVDGSIRVAHRKGRLRPCPSLLTPGNVVGHEPDSRFIPGSRRTFSAQALRELTTRNDPVSLSPTTPSHIALLVSSRRVFLPLFLVLSFFLSPSTNNNNLIRFFSSSPDTIMT